LAQEVGAKELARLGRSIGPPGVRGGKDIFEGGRGFDERGNFESFVDFWIDFDFVLFSIFIFYFIFNKALFDV
jgi:hypothetical protein